MHRERGFLTLTIDNATEIFRSPRYITRAGQAVKLRGFSWNLIAFRTKVNGTPHVGVFVECRDEGKHRRGPWTCRATCVIRIRSSAQDDAISQMSDEFSNSDFSHGVEDILSVKVSVIRD